MAKAPGGAGMKAAACMPLMLCRMWGVWGRAAVQWKAGKAGRHNVAARQARCRWGGMTVRSKACKAAAGGEGWWQAGVWGWWGPSRHEQHVPGRQAVQAGMACRQAGIQGNVHLMNTI